MAIQNSQYLMIRSKTPNNPKIDVGIIKESFFSFGGIQRGQEQEGVSARILLRTTSDGIPLASLTVENTSR